MEIKRIFPKCWLKGYENQVAYWLECSYEEAKEHVAPILADDFSLICSNNENVCFLISKDLTIVTLLPWHYPFSGLWNGYSPFISIDAVRIEQLEEIRTLDIRKSNI